MIQVQERFEVDIKELPEQIDTSTYSMDIIPVLLIFFVSTNLSSIDETFWIAVSLMFFMCSLSLLLFLTNYFLM